MDILYPILLGFVAYFIQKYVCRRLQIERFDLRIVVMIVMVIALNAMIWLTLFLLTGHTPADWK